MVPGNLTLSVNITDRTPSQHQVRQIRLYESKMQNSMFIPQISPRWVSWTCGGDWEPHGHKPRVRLNPGVPGAAALRHDSLLRARVHLVCCGSGRLAVAQDTHLCGGVSTHLLLGAILLDMRSSNGALVLLAVVAASAFRSLLLAHHTLQSREPFYKIHSSSLDNTSRVSTRIILMSEAGTRNVCWDAVADL